MARDDVHFPLALDEIQIPDGQRRSTITPLTCWRIRFSRDRLAHPWRLASHSVMYT
jgi:hypothetical protein